jgi:hypothetical protein
MSRNEKFVSEPITPSAGTFDTEAMAKGEPGLPSCFIWRAKEYPVVQIMDKWKETSPCRSGAKEKYVRKHWYSIRSAGGLIMKIYFERKSMSRNQKRVRWWLFSVSRKDKEQLS